MLPFRGMSPAAQLAVMGGGLLVLVGAECALLFNLSSHSPSPVASPTPSSLASTPTPPASNEGVYTAPGVQTPDVGAFGTSPTAPSDGTSASKGLPAPALTLTNPLLAPSGTPKPGAPAKPTPDPRLVQAAQLFDQGSAAIKRGDKKAAAALWERVAKLAPSDAATRQNLMSVYTDLKQPKAALPHAIALTRLSPKNASPQFQLARLYLSLNQPKAALAPLQTAVRLDPKVRDGHTYLARLLVDLKQPRAALQQWTYLAQKNGHDIEAHLFAAAVANDLLRAPSTAQKWLRRSIAQNPRDPQAPISLAQLLMARRDAKGAAAVLTQAVRTSPNSFELYSALAQARVAAKDRTGAIAALQSALARVPKTGRGAALVESDLHMTLGQLYGDSKQTKEAREQFALAAKLSPRDPQPPALEAMAAIQLNDLPAAAKLLAQASTLAPKNPRIRLFYAQTLAQNKQWKDADEQYQIYCQSVPRDKGALAEWAQVARQTKNLPRELQIWDKLSALDPKNPLVWEQVGTAQLLAGHKNEALAAWKKKMALAPRDLNTILQVADLQTDMGDARGAMSTRKQAIDARPDYAPAYVMLLKAGEDANQKDDARDYVAQKLASQPQNAGALSGVIKFYEDKKRTEDAQTLLSDILKRNPQATLAKNALDSYGTSTAAPTATKTP